MLKYLYQNKWCAKLLFKFQACQTLKKKPSSFYSSWVNNLWSTYPIALEVDWLGSFIPSERLPAKSAAVERLWENGIQFFSASSLLPPTRHMRGLGPNLSEGSATLEVEEAGKTGTWPGTRLEFASYISRWVRPGFRNQDCLLKTTLSKSQRERTWNQTQRVNSQG